MIADPQRIMLLGDTHGSHNWTIHAIKHAADNGADVIVQLGDFGFWTGHAGYMFQRDVHAALVEHDVQLYWLDGNHECVDQDTRAVTRRGFVSVDDLRSDDEILSMDDDGYRTWLPIDGIVRRHYDGEMHGIKTRGIDMLVTPGHRVVGKDPKGKWVEYRGDEIHRSRTFKIQVATSGESLESNVDDDVIKLHAWCLTDSHHRRDGGWHFFQRESAANRITSLLDRLEIPYSVSKRHRKIVEICGKPVKSSEPEVTVRIGVEAARELPFAQGRLESFVWQLSQRQVDVFLEELVYCDGSIATGTRGSSGVLYGGPSDTQWWDQLQILLATNGYRTTRSVFCGRDCRLNFSRRNSIEFTQGQTRTYVQQYVGTVWCLMVANGRFFVERNSKVFLTGNCHTLLNECLGDSREPTPLNSHFPRITYLPRGCRWTWWGKTWMALGGAVSVDKMGRKEGVSWWPGETLKQADVEYASRPGKVDVLVAHDAPFGVHIPGIKPKGQSDWPDWVLDESYDHQRKVRDVMEATRPDLMAHGHFHTRYQGLHQYSDGSRCLVQGLDCDGTTLERNTLFINRDAP